MEKIHSGAVGDIVALQGMYLTGGGSLLRGLDLLLAQECEVPVHLTERPRQTVIHGAGLMLLPVLLGGTTGRPGAHGHAQPLLPVVRRAHLEAARIDRQPRAFIVADFLELFVQRLRIVDIGRAAGELGRRGTSA